MSNPTTLAMQAIVDAYQDVTKLFLADPMHYQVRTRLQEIEQCILKLVETPDAKESEVTEPLVVEFETGVDSDDGWYFFNDRLVCLAPLEGKRVTVTIREAVK